MEAPSKLAMFLIYLFSLFLQTSKAGKIILVDGVSEWKDPTVTAGDTIIFKHRYNYNVFIFRSESAFQLCNFTQATMLTKPNLISFTWHPSRVGFFYFAFNNNSAEPCQQGQKLAVKVTLTQSPTSPPLPEPSPATSQPPVTGGIVSSSPAFSWPFRPREWLSPSPEPTSAIISPENGEGGGVPFIDSNPAVALPNGAVDSAAIRPVSTSDGGPALQVVGFSVIYKVLCCVLFIMLL